MATSQPLDALACDRFRPRLWRRGKCKRCNLPRALHVKRPESAPPAVIAAGLPAESIAISAQSTAPASAASRTAKLIHVAPAAQEAPPGEGALDLLQYGSRELNSLAGKKMPCCASSWPSCASACRAWTATRRSKAMKNRKWRKRRRQALCFFRCIRLCDFCALVED